ncbi:MAG: hypothetical protein RTU09_04580 [Candidatus Thorarchaeota archaeon]
MVMRRIFGRKKDDDEEDSKAESPTPEETPEAIEVETEEDAAEETEVASVEAGTIPYHTSLTDRFKYMFDDPDISAGLEGTDEFFLEFMAMGERFWFAKKAKGEVESGTGAVQNEDVYIRLGNDAVGDLLGAATFSEFQDFYMKYYKNPEAGKFIKIELRKDVSGLNRRGYARVPLLKLLIGMVR